MRIETSTTCTSMSIISLGDVSIPSERLQSNMTMSCYFFSSHHWCCMIWLAAVYLVTIKVDYYRVWATWLLGYYIPKTCLYNFYPLKPHFCIVKLGFTGVFIIFLIFAENIDCGYPLKLPRWGSSNEYPQCMFWAEIRKIPDFFYLKLFTFWW